MWKQFNCNTILAVLLCVHFCHMETTIEDEESFLNDNIDDKESSIYDNIDDEEEPAYVPRVVNVTLNDNIDDEQEPAYVPRVAHKQAHVPLVVNASLNDNIDNEEEPAYVPRVVNGSAAKLGEVPYQLAFKHPKGKIFTTFCGGSIIGPNKVLTAAHCFEERTSRCIKLFRRGRINKKTLKNKFAVAGNLMNQAIYTKGGENDGQWRKLRSMYVPPRYKFPLLDIGVGFTTEPFIFDSNVASKPYAKEFKDYKGKCLVSGYGMISAKQRSLRLLTAYLEVLPLSRCSKLHRKNMNRFICTSDKVSDVNKGDSGGPLVCDGIIVGVVSGNRRRAGSFFTRVSSFKTFIETAEASRLYCSGLLMCAPIIIQAGILLC